jgi:thiol-disulfide isomerase/thioredoxin/uncharacterized membrane protein YphA (DoxX/SURF4 family)
MLKKYLPWSIRILIFVVFIISGVAKLFPVWAFEKQMVDLGITSWCYAPYLSRFIIALELSIGILMLQSHYLKKIVIPATVLLLFAFCIHLVIQMIAHGAMSGNCGCFGQLIPMTPLEAFIKNVISIGLLIYLYKNVSDKEPGQNKFVYLVVAYLGTALALYVFFPFCPCKDSRVGKEAATVSLMVKSSGRNSETIVTDDSNVANPDKSKGMGTSANGNTLSASSESGPKKARSRYSAYTTFGSQVVDLDEGKKIVCLFSPGCDHCMEAAREITALSRKISLPPVYILFMDEETEKIPSFFKVANATYPYKILDVPVFWELMGSDANTPAVILLWNGNVMKYYEGIEGNKFDVADLETACKSF